ncbi:uncharacterized protein CIMG_04472 [Coccidioides immitis RS]|uniref:Uncharacterized protein n=1 Tax=Coccidioides immitis (strain RS) TaxID=246410 RepID=A0A0E1RX62_COCIM|nr:uncharacterized protein CIMG_04472 [Coccidioides immitis RS]EAS33448.2 hypothetical protein CIMG_04472 [Coccidioides immitis RS]
MELNWGGHEASDGFASFSRSFDDIFDHSIRTIHGEDYSTANLLLQKIRGRTSKSALSSSLSTAYWSSSRHAGMQWYGEALQSTWLSINKASFSAVNYDRDKMECNSLGRNSRLLRPMSIKLITSTLFPCLKVKLWTHGCQGLKEQLRTGPSNVFRELFWHLVVQVSVRLPDTGLKVISFSNPVGRQDISHISTAIKGGLRNFLEDVTRKRCTIEFARRELANVAFSSQPLRPIFPSDGHEDV